MIPKKIIFSDRAINAIKTETFDKIKTETGGILLGIKDEQKWYVIESIDPGPNSIFSVSYFEYDTDYVNHLAKVISKQYKNELCVLGLWHRHPGSLDSFSSTDDETNKTFSKISKSGIISGIVNLDKDFRLTLYHVPHNIKYNKVDFDFDNSSIPKSYFIYKNF
jgi:integrative and conjugative element protein (TIGR02256 family)